MSRQVCAQHSYLKAMVAPSPDPSLTFPRPADLFPLLALSQPITVLAMAWDGVLYGAGGFRYAAISMALAAAPAIAVMYGGGGAVHEVSRLLAGGGWQAAAGGSAAAATVGTAAAALSGEDQLGAVWAGLGVLMLMRWLTIWVPYKLQAGPFAKLKGEDRRPAAEH